MRRVGGPMFVALNAAVRDLGDEQRRCLRAADADAANHPYSLELVVMGERSVGAMVETVRVRKIVDLGLGQAPFEIPTSAESCIAALLSMIELPPSDGPGTMRATLRVNDSCPHL